MTTIINVDLKLTTLNKQQGFYHFMNDLIHNVQVNTIELLPNEARIERNYRMTIPIRHYSIEAPDSKVFAEIVKVSMRHFDDVIVYANCYK